MPPESQKQISPAELAKARLDKNDKTRVLLSQMPPELKKKVGAELNAHPKAAAFFEGFKSVGGAFWKGWEQGVNGAIHGTADLFDKTGTWIGETTAEAIHGKEGGLTDKLVKDTQWIRDGLDTTGQVLGETAAKIISTGERKEVLQSTKDYWKGKVNQILAMSAEERAHAAGGGLAFVATAVVGAKGLNTLSRTEILAQELSFGGKSMLARGANKAIQEGGQIGMEMVGGNRTETPRPNLHPNKPSKTIVEANAALNETKRIEKAEEVLGRKLTPEQKEALLKAHNHGNNGVYEYTQSEINRKARILEESGFTKEERRKLMQEGVAGTPKQKSITPEKGEKPLDTTAVPKYDDKKPLEVNSVLKGEIEKIAEYGENNLERILESANPADALGFKRLNSRGNAWIRAKLGNLKNFVEYVERADKIGLNEADLISVRNYMKKRILNEGLVPLTRMTDSLTGEGKLVLNKQNIRRLERLYAKIKSIPDLLITD